jgi:hypothetical protein
MIITPALGVAVLSWAGRCGTLLPLSVQPRTQDRRFPTRRSGTWVTRLPCSVLKARFRQGVAASVCGRLRSAGHPGNSSKASSFPVEFIAAAGVLTPPGRGFGQ